MPFQRYSDGDFSYEDDGDVHCTASKLMVSDFQRDGFIIVRNLFSGSEVAKINLAAEQSTDYWNAAWTVADNDAKRYWVTQWREPGSDIFGMCARTEKVLKVAEQLLDEGELFMYSGKIIMKEAKTGGRVEWHQDYGYWYNNECLTPDLVSCFIALTKNDRENGGLEVLRGSHHCGRINHGFVGSQQGADPQRVNVLLDAKRFTHVYCDLKAGDAIFFHCNILHRSEANESNFKRWNLIYSYCTVKNSSPKPHYNAIYTEPLLKMPCDAIKNCADLTVEKREYINPDDSPNLRDTGRVKNGVH